MALSVVQIANMALGRVGVSDTIVALDESSPESRVCSLYWEPMRDAVLMDFPWPFAQRWVDLALVSSDPNDDWYYAYRWPNDCLRPRRVTYGDKRASMVNVPMSVGSDTGGRLIYCDIETAGLHYTALVSDPAMWTPDFASAMAWRLAAEIAMPLSLAPAMRDNARAMYEREIGRVQARALNDERIDPMPVSEFTAVREGIVMPGTIGDWSAFPVGTRIG